MLKSESPDVLTQDLSLTIHDLARGGAGVAREDSGRVIFVPFTAPGDRVRVRITETKKNYAQGELLEIIEPSVLRQTPPCKVFGRCGGCQWQHLPYEAQWKTKVQGVLHALVRVQIQVENPVELPAERIWEYRNRIQLRGFRQELGFFAAGTNDRVPVNRCEIARPEINAVWEEVRSEGSRLDRPYKVEVEVLPDGSVRKSWNSSHGALGFRQVHDEQNEKLKTWVEDALTPGGALLDLYGGSGNLSLGLTSKMSRIDCVDTGSPRENSSGSGRFTFHRHSVSAWIAKKASQKPLPVYDSAILDPPREGLGTDFAVIAQSLEALGVKEIAAVGCDADAWARDVSKFVKRGWRLERIAILDLFPQTPHVESLALLVRAKSVE